MNPPQSAIEAPHDDNQPSAPTSVHASSAGRLEAARAWALRAEQSARDAPHAWLRCAVDAYRSLEVDDHALADAAAAIATRAADQLLSRLLQQHPAGWSAGPLQIGEVRLQVEFRQVSPCLQPPLRIRRAHDVPMDAFGGERHHRPGFGVPLAALSSPHGQASPLGRLQPRTGAFRNLTAWIEPDAQDADAPPRLVLADPHQLAAIAVGKHGLELARDSSAAYAWAMQTSKLERRGLWSLLGGDQISARAGVFLLDDYDPNKRPLVMIHGLGSIPLIWAHLSNAVWGADDLRARYQIWQVVYETDAPLLVARARIRDYLQQAWRLLDPEGTAPARHGTVLVGHSLGGVIARLLCVDSGDALWNAAFLVPPHALEASAEDLEAIKRIFSFPAYPGIGRAIFIAAPHRGIGATVVLDRLGRALVSRRAPEVHALRRIAQANPDAIRPQLRAAFLQGEINSVTTLQSEQPVRRAAEQLLPPAGLPYHTIAGVQPGRRKPSDGFVALESTLIPGAASCLVVEAGHRLHGHPQVVAEVLRILRE